MSMENCLNRRKVFSVLAGAFGVLCATGHGRAAGCLGVAVDQDYPAAQRTTPPQPKPEEGLPWRSMKGADMGVLTKEQWALLDDFHITGFDFFLHRKDADDFNSFLDQLPKHDTDHE
jgi:hypothetical protein